MACVRFSNPESEYQITAAFFLRPQID